jgi:hypothetical protein
MHEYFDVTRSDTPFFIPHLAEDSPAAEAEWQRLCELAHAPQTSRRVYALTFAREDAEWELTVGKPKRRHARKTGPRGGHRDEGYHKSASEVGYGVAAIIYDADRGVIYVWNYDASKVRKTLEYVGKDSVSRLEYFAN